MELLAIIVIDNQSYKKKHGHVFTNGKKQKREQSEFPCS